MNNGKKKSNSSPEINLALVGELGCGKSALTVKYITKRFIMEYAPFLEDTYIKHDTIANQEIIIHIMDTFDKDDSDANRYLRWADSLMVVYSITDKGSFESAREYCDVISQYTKTNNRDIPVALVANKIDLELYREVSKEAGEQLAIEYDCAFYETTAAEDVEYVDNMFHSVIVDYLRDRNMLPYYYAEDKGPNSAGGFLAPPSGSFSLLRPRSPKPHSDKKDEKHVSRKTSATSFKLFNKGFKIFN